MLCRRWLKFEPLGPAGIGRYTVKSDVRERALVRMVALAKPWPLLYLSAFLRVDAGPRGLVSAAVEVGRIRLRGRLLHGDRSLIRVATCRTQQRWH